MQIAGIELYSSFVLDNKRTCNSLISRSENSIFSKYGASMIAELFIIVDEEVVLKWDKYGDVNIIPVRLNNFHTFL